MTTPDTTPESPEYTPTDREFRDWIVVVDTIGGHGGESIRRFDRWLAAHDAGVARKALTDAAAEIPQQMRLDELALHQLDYTAQLPEPSQVMLNGATRFAERLVARAEQIGEK